ncbi:MAG: Succinyl-CoA ligase [ADP-forming] subunit alpha [Candidatus Thorarchaeota archaeon AB_25]|nr:MAG: Succinyl-CoA ligase [ADP-forming] subunit alpha [Candidatus Thorarchaeota archaeon AB_25]
MSELLDIKSLAIVGVSQSMGYYWAHSMLQWEHNLRIWLVSRRGGEVLGHKILTSVDDIPEEIDYAIIRVPYRAVPETLLECHKKGARGVTIFTSGFSELGTEEGKQREVEIRHILDETGMRAFGPNCMGLMYPKLGIAFMPTIKRLSGDVGFLSQSGGVAITAYTAGVESGVGFSKVFSFGNQVDITPQELLDYFLDDDETKAVGAYIEGVKNGKDILNSMRRLATKKPLVILKGGRSGEGARAASSHTGALAGSGEIWNAAFLQANVLTVATLEDMLATLGLVSLSPQPKSRNVGLIAISGGTSVIHTDICIEKGLKVPKTSEETIRKLDPLILDVGTGLSNPIDLAADYYQDQTTSEVIRIAGEEPKFDSLIIGADVHNMFQAASIMGAGDVLVEFWKVMAEAGKKVVEKENKPVLVTIPDVAYPVQRTEAWRAFVDQGLPVFRNINETVSALSRVCDYYETKEKRASKR